jgi:hypothetical protein
MQSVVAFKQRSYPEELGRGWEYKVYAYGHGQVLKVPQSFSDQVMRIASTCIRKMDL